MLRGLYKSSTHRRQTYRDIFTAITHSLKPSKHLAYLASEQHSTWRFYNDAPGIEALIYLLRSNTAAYLKRLKSLFSHPEVCLASFLYQYCQVHTQRKWQREESFTFSCPQAWLLWLLAMGCYLTPPAETPHGGFSAIVQRSTRTTSWTVEVLTFSGVQTKAIVESVETRIIFKTRSTSSLEGTLKMALSPRLTTKVKRSK